MKDLEGLDCLTVCDNTHLNESETEKASWTSEVRSTGMGEKLMTQQGCRKLSLETCHTV